MLATPKLKEDFTRIRRSISKQSQGAGSMPCPRLQIKGVTPVEKFVDYWAMARYALAASTVISVDRSMLAPVPTTVVTGDQFLPSVLLSTE